MKNAKFHALLRECLGPDGKPYTITRLAEELDLARPRLNDTLNNKPLASATLKGRQHGGHTRGKVAAFIVRNWPKKARLILESLGWNEKGELGVPCGKLHMEQTESPRPGRGGEGVDSGAAEKTLETVAEILGTTKSSVAEIEYKALQKLREQIGEDPDFLAALRQGVFRRARPDAGEEMLDCLLEIARWYDLYEQLVTEQKQDDAVACMDEIKRCFKVISDSLDANA